MSNVCLLDTGDTMGQGRPLKELRLSDGEREELLRWTRRARTGQALALRARIVLDCASGKTNTEVAATHGVTKQMVGKWRARFVERRADGLLDEPRPGRPRRSPAGSPSGWPRGRTGRWRGAGTRRCRPAAPRS